MQKLDLSLDIPGAPIVRQAPPEPEWEQHPFDLSRDADVTAGASTGAASRRRPHLRAVPAPLALVTPDGAASALTAPSRPGEDLPSPGEGAGAHGALRDRQAPQAHTAIVSPEDAQVRQKVLAALRDLHPSETSTVPAAATMAGDLVCKAIRVQGELCGSVKASGLVYMEDGAVLNGRILDAEIVILAGTVSADVNQVAVRCSGLVVLAQSARVVGHIQCRAVAIYEGACLVGTVQCLPSLGSLHD